MNKYLKISALILLGIFLLYAGYRAYMFFKAKGEILGNSAQNEAVQEDAKRNGTTYASELNKQALFLSRNRSAI